MMPVLPAPIVADLLQRNSGNANLMLATVRHPTFETLYVANNPVDVVSNGITYIAGAFDVALVNDDGKPPRAAFKFPNVSPLLGQKISAVVDPIEVSLQIVSAADFNTVIYPAPRLQLLNVVISPDFITGDLAGRDWSSEPLGTIVVTPQRFPALFRRRS